MHDTERETTDDPRDLAADADAGTDAATPPGGPSGPGECSADLDEAQANTPEPQAEVAEPPVGIPEPQADVAELPVREPPSRPEQEALRYPSNKSPTLEPGGQEPPGETEISATPEQLPGGQEDGPAIRDEGDADADTETLESPEGMGEQEITTERVVEAVLFASEAPLPLSKIVSVLGVGSARDVRNHIKSLNDRYAQTGASFRIEQIASGYQMLTLPTYNTWIRRLRQTSKDNKLSQAAMETLAVVAYKQPVVRADIEAIRGVSAGEMLNRLRELGLIKIVGRAEDVGRPMLYGTTRRFLEVFGLSGLEDLPSVEEMPAGE